MRTKKKLPALPEAELHTVVDLPLHVLVEYLNRIETDDLDFMVNEDGVDYLIFRIAPRTQAWTHSVEINGHLRRWEGTYTRVDADSKIRIRGEWLESLSDMATLLGFMLLYNLILFILLGMIGLSYGIESFALALIAAWVTTRNIEPVDLFGNIRHNALKHADQIMQQIADVIRASSAQRVIPYDGSEDDLLRVLQQNIAPRRLRMDGELE